MYGLKTTDLAAYVLGVKEVWQNFFHIRIICYSWLGARDFSDAPRCLSWYNSRCDWHHSDIWWSRSACVIFRCGHHWCRTDRRNRNSTLSNIVHSQRVRCYYNTHILKL